MSFLVSPGVHVREIDLTNVIPSVQTTIGAIAGAFEKGPISSVTSVSSEEELIAIFGKPKTTSNQFENWFAAANFLQYSDHLKVVRCETTTVNAGANSGILIRDDDHYEASFSTGQGSHGEWAARTAGTWGNSIGVQICSTATGYEQVTDTSNQLTNGAASAAATSITVDNADESGHAFNVGDLISFFSDTSATVPIDEFNEYEVTVVNTTSNALTIRLKDDPNGGGLQNAIADNSYIRRKWKYHDLFAGAPGQSQWSKDNGRGIGDEMHIVVYDTTGDITGYDADVVGQRTSSVIETYSNVSKSSVARDAQGNSNYYADVIFRESNYIYWTDHVSGGTNWGTDTTSTYTVLHPITIDSLTGGTDDYAVSAGELTLAYDKFADTELHDINLVIGG